MKRLWNRIKNDKLLFGLFVFVCVVIVFDLFTVVFDIIQLVIVSKNRAGIYGMFSVINLISGGLTALSAILITLYIVLRKN